MRWTVSSVLMVSLVVAFIDRLNLAYAMPRLAAYYGWSEAETGAKGGLLLGCFYIAYAVSNLALSPVAERFGPRRSLMAVVVLFSGFTMLGAPLSFSFPLFMLTRVLLGFGEGVHFPMMASVTKRWFPLHERSRGNAIWVFGGTLATMLTPLLLVPVIGHFGWRVMLVGCGLLGMCITIPLLHLFVYDRPRQSPRIRPEEVAYIEAGLEKDEPVAGGYAFLRLPAFWLALGSGILNNYCIYGLLNWLPTYFVKQKGIDFEKLWYAAPIPYVAAFLAFILYSYLGDKLNKRVALGCMGFFGAAVCVYLATRAPSLPLVLLAFSFATFLQAAFISQEFAIDQRILPASAIGKAVGLYNGLAVLCGAVGGTLLLGQIVALTGSYDAGMYSVVAAAAVGGVIMLGLSRAVKY